MKNSNRERLYLDYVNNFLTVDRFAEYYALSIKTANEVINEGRILHNITVETNKSIQLNK
jgi:hypothetical protein